KGRREDCRKRYVKNLSAEFTRQPCCFPKTLVQGSPSPLEGEGAPQGRMRGALSLPLAPTAQLPRRQTKNIPGSSPGIEHYATFRFRSGGATCPTNSEIASATDLTVCP